MIGDSTTKVKYYKVWNKVEKINIRIYPGYFNDSTIDFTKLALS